MAVSGKVVLWSLERVQAVIDALPARYRGLGVVATGTELTCASASSWITSTQFQGSRARLVVVTGHSKSELLSSPLGTTAPISGHDARFGEEYQVEAFVPNDLLDRIDLPGPAWMAVSEAMSELGRLDAAASLVPNPQLIVRTATRREAVGTSALSPSWARDYPLLIAEHSRRTPTLNAAIDHLTQLVTRIASAQ